MWPSTSPLALRPRARHVTHDKASSAACAGCPPPAADRSRAGIMIGRMWAQRVGPHQGRHWGSVAARSRRAPLAHPTPPLRRRNGCRLQPMQSPTSNHPFNAALRDEEPRSSRSMPAQQQHDAPLNSLQEAGHPGVQKETAKRRRPMAWGRELLHRAPPGAGAPACPSCAL